MLSVVTMLLTDVEHVTNLACQRATTAERYGSVLDTVCSVSLEDLKYKYTSRLTVEALLLDSNLSSMTQSLLLANI